jgi:hypothetical protein
MTSAQIVLTTENMIDGTTVGTTSGVGGATSVENASVMILVCKVPLLGPLRL